MDRIAILLLIFNMGGRLSKGGILEKSPLRCIFKHWKQIAGPPVGVTTREDLSTVVSGCHCNVDDGEKWPVNGMLNYNALLQLMLFLRREVG